jgi:dipeptidase E
MKLLLSGGGENVMAIDSFFSSKIDVNQTVLYVPNAKEDPEITYDQCLEWFTRNYSKYGIKKIEMRIDLEKIVLTDKYSAIYVGGGNTYKLLKEIKESGFYRKIIDFLNHGGFVYGSSAGSIIFGRDIIATTYEDENNVGLNDSKGLNLVNGFDVCCHYGDEKSRNYKRNRIEKYALESNGTIALPDDCGIYVENGTISFIGSGAVIFKV